ncbi:hypothetical protein CO151_14225 [bacterium CG_4_9_14_3_um_filter_65_15]|nr:MAG: hypothetical protein CO151_14225 [bacterium CG_4_9_14_3_um_filter_65_15]
MVEKLSAPELINLIRKVFHPCAEDRGLAFIVDVPDDRRADSADWAQRRRLAAEWFSHLSERAGELPVTSLSLFWYPHVGGNNADLPATMRRHGGTVPDHARDLGGLPGLPTEEIFRDHGLIIAPTELSATAPLKVAARAAGTGPNGFRAATMPGFLPSMVPALRLDYGEINRRVSLLKKLLDTAESARFSFRSGGRVHMLELDLRHRLGHASGGLLRGNGIAGNLPSGEAYIVPYEGEREGDPSRSAGILPVEIDGEVVIYEIEGNRAVAVLSAGPVSEAEAARLVAEPAYANLAELGLGVLGDFGLDPTGSILLDEKLGPHIAFGRSDHFGGTVGPGDFTSPEAVIHLDRVFIPAMQPQVEVLSVVLAGDGRERPIIENGRFLGLA